MPRDKKGPDEKNQPNSDGKKKKSLLPKTPVTTREVLITNFKESTTIQDLQETFYTTVRLRPMIILTYDRFGKIVAYAFIEKQHIVEVFRKLNGREHPKFFKPIMMKLGEKSISVKKVLQTISAIECKKDVSVSIGNLDNFLIIIYFRKPERYKRDLRYI